MWFVQIVRSRYWALGCFSWKICLLATFSCRLSCFCSALVIWLPLQYLEITACRPAALPPKPLCRLVVRIEENAAPENPHRSQRCKAPLDHLTPQTTASILRQDRQVMQIATPSFMAAEHGTNQTWAISGNQTEPRISVQEGPKLFLGVGFVQSHPFHPAPQIEHGFEIAGCHGRECDIHPIIPGQGSVGARFLNTE